MLSPGSSLTTAEVAEYVNTRVSKVKRLTGGVVLVDTIPKNPVSCTFRKSPKDTGRHCTWMSKVLCEGIS